jgi:type I restriction enzyme M protein
MTTDSVKDIEKLEAQLWEAADNLRANSKLTSSDLVGAYVRDV